MNYYVTTSIPYVNGPPHVGFGMELVMADVLARAARQQNKPVIFVTGADEHGTKIAQTAASKNLTPQLFVDKSTQEFIKVGKLLNISNDRFIRTTDEDHIKRAQLIWKMLKADIYKAKYIGWYDVKQEEFVPEGHADPERMKPSHPQAYQRVEEDNYFFKLSKYTDRVKEAIETNRLNILPKPKRNEILSLLNEGLEDISISRPKKTLEWGIPVPGDSTQVMYVWFEALMNYITVLGYPESEDFKKFWPANVQVIGKDIIRFHAAIWPAMLMSLDLPLPNTLYVHGFINIDGEKLSKSLGNGIHPEEITKKYGVDAFRYYFLRHVPSYNDGDFSWSTFEAAYNNELANELGNLVQRTVAMVIRYQGGIIGEIPDSEHDIAEYLKAISQCRFDHALDKVWEQIRGLNQYIDEEKPWEVAKLDKDHLREILAYQCSSILEIADLLEPFLPDTSAKIHKIFDTGIVALGDETLFPKKESEDAPVANDSDSKKTQS